MKHVLNIAFIGAGNMARSIISGLVKNGYPAHTIYASDPSREQLEQLNSEFGIHIDNDNAAVAYAADVIVLAVKPQMMAQVCQDLRSRASLDGKLFISIAAGILVERLQQLLGQSKVIRTMPNTPALLGLGMTGLYTDHQVSDEECHFAEQLMSAVGKTCWVEKQSQLNTVIAAAGSAPAYFFLFMDAMIQQAVAQGLSHIQARQLVEQAAKGAAAMVEANPELTLEQLRLQVTSKGGTTFEAIRIFEEGGLVQLVGNAMQAAVKRAEEMEQQF